MYTPFSNLWKIQQLHIRPLSFDRRFLVGDGRYSFSCRSSSWSSFSIPHIHQVLLYIPWIPHIHHKHLAGEAIGKTRLMCWVKTFNRFYTLVVGDDSVVVGVVISDRITSTVCSESSLTQYWENDSTKVVLESQKKTWMRQETSECFKWLPEKDLTVKTFRWNPFERDTLL